MGIQIAGFGDLLAFADSLPFLDQQLAVVAVDTGMGRAVLEDDQIAIAADVGGERHLAAETGKNRLPLGSGNTNALAEFVGCGITADHRALHRPCPPAQGDLGRRGNGSGFAGAFTGGSRRGLGAAEADGLTDVHRIGRIDPVEARQLLETPAMARGDRIQGIAALDLIGTCHNFVGRDALAGGMRATSRYRQHKGDHNRPEKHTTSFSRRRPWPGTRVLTVTAPYAP
ncbi:hypothetical protein D3C77_308830 [compost metagenome]